MLEICDLRSGYQGREVLHGLSLTVSPGEVLVVAGANGCGKSTLLKTLIRAVRPTGGTVRVDGTDWDGLSPNELARRLAYLPQGKAVPDITAGRLVLHGRFPYLRYPRRYSREDRALAMAAMERLGIAHLRHTPMQSLSGGTRQKVYIAMALCQNSPYILMDEPTTYLDVRHQFLLLDVAKELAAEGKGVVMVLHDLPMAMAVADRLALMGEGTLLDVGAPAEVLSRGSIQAAFGVALKSVDTPEGSRYYYVRMEG